VSASPYCHTSQARVPYRWQQKQLNSPVFGKPLGKTQQECLRSRSHTCTDAYAPNHHACLCCCITCPYSMWTWPS
jgi:hypothetical protein